MGFLANKAKRRSATFWEHEEQIVPALVNAEKKHERRMSLQLLNEASVRRSGKKISVVLDAGDRYLDNGSFTRESEETTETAQLTGHDLTPQSATQQENSPAQQLGGPADRLESVIAALDGQLTAMLTRLGDSVNRLQATEIAQQDVLLEFQTIRLGGTTDSSPHQVTPQETISSINRSIQEADAEWREDADRREERLQTMLDEVSDASVLIPCLRDGIEPYPVLRRRKLKQRYC